MTRRTEGSDGDPPEKNSWVNLGSLDAFLVFSDAIFCPKYMQP